MDTMDTEDARRLPLVWDMETGDPDDFFTLLWLSSAVSVRYRRPTHVRGVDAVAAELAWQHDAVRRSR